MAFLKQILADLFQFADGHAGVLLGGFIVIALIVMYVRDEMDGFFPWLGRAASEKGEPSAKNLVYILAGVFLCWGYSKIVLAVCRWIDKGNDPTFIVLTMAGILAALVGVTKVMAMRTKIGANEMSTPEEPK